MERLLEIAEEHELETLEIVVVANVLGGASLVLGLDFINTKLERLFRALGLILILFSFSILIIALTTPKRKKKHIVMIEEVYDVMRQKGYVKKFKR